MSFVYSYRELVSEKPFDKKAFLDFLDNRQFYGSQSGTLEVTRVDRKTHNNWKWRTWQSVRDNNYLVARINNRLIGSAELVFDLDPALDESVSALKARLESLILDLKSEGAQILGVFRSGGRGYHVHVILPALSLMSDTERVRTKLVLLEHFGCDTQKSSNRVMILLENSEHDKTSSPKELLE